MSAMFGWFSAAIELRVARAVDLAHSASADRREDFAGTEPLAGLEFHLFAISAPDGAAPGTS